MSNEKEEIIEVREFDPEMIPPFTSKFKDPGYSGGSKVVILGKPGCFVRTTPILMFNGTIKNVEDIQVGEQVMGWDSKSRNVLELCRDNDEMFKIIPTKGESYTVNLLHKLVLKCSTGDVIEITVKDFLNKEKSWQKMWCVFRVEIEFSNKDVEIDSYEFGFRRNFNNIREEYKINDRDNRLQLLAGILDSNGYYDNINDKYIIQETEEVANDIIFIARSLGFLSYKTKITKLCYRISIVGDIEKIPCKILKTEGKHKSRENVLTSGFSIEPQGYGDYYGFTLDGDHRFLLGSFDVVRNTGKTTLIKSLLYAKKHIFPVGMVMSGTEDITHDFEKNIPGIFIYNDYEEEKLYDFVKRQKLAKQYLENPWSFCVVDDCSDDPKLLKKVIQQMIFKKSRHFKSMYILSLQYLGDILPVIRTNIDICFIGRESLLRNRKSLFLNYASIVPDFETFCVLMDALAGDYTMLVINNTIQTNKWQDAVFFYKPIPVPSGWKMGCSSYWDFDTQRRNPNYVDTVIN